MIKNAFKFLTILLTGVFVTLALSACSSSSNGYKPIGNSADRPPVQQRDQNEILDDLQQRVDIIETDLNELKPSIANLMAIEGDMKELITELSKISQPSTSQPSVMYPNNMNTVMANNAPTPLTQGDEINNTPIASTPAPAAPKLSSDHMSTTVTDVRVGQHHNKVRLVLDFKKGSNIDQSVSKVGGNVVVTLKNTGWGTGISWKSSKSPLISSYTASTEGNNALLSIATRGDDLTVKVFTLPALKVSSGPRLVLDFEKGVQ